MKKFKLRFLRPKDTRYPNRLNLVNMAFFIWQDSRLMLTHPCIELQNHTLRLSQKGLSQNGYRTSGTSHEIIWAHNDLPRYKIITTTYTVATGHLALSEVSDHTTVTMALAAGYV